MVVGIVKANDCMQVYAESEVGEIDDVCWLWRWLT